MWCKRELLTKAGLLEVPVEKKILYMQGVWRGTLHKKAVS
jgi:hypothetical protein